ncbi:cell division protein FtsA [Lachnospiraceae bacterium]|nr:cell division protein FtsA [Lachnospiraceae bacterium]
MAKGQAKKVPVKVQAKVQPKAKTEVQADNMVFSLDIGTRSIIGMVGVVVEDKVKIIAIEKEEHNERAMIDGQIENIEKVSALAKKVKKRLEDKVHTKLKRVSVAAAGRALRTSRVDYEMVLQGPQVIDDEVINRLEAGAISKAEAQFDAENEAQEDTRRFYLVGYTVCQYYLDQYMISSLKDHRGKHIKVDLIATFLPSEVVESLYTTMNKIGLEVASITLEPIAAINAAIPENLRLLNLVIVDIGAGTSDIAACTSGSVTGYTMATIAGDEITESIMKEFLVDFMTAENMKAQIENEEEITFTDILGFERKASRDEIFRCIQGTSESLCREIAGKILDVNGSAPSALFLAGGGSKLAGLKEGLTAALEMDSNRVAIAGNNFRTSAFSDEYDLNNPEYATPLGIAISSGLNMINDSFRVTLNEKSAKLFRSGSFTVMNLLMMNGYGFQDMLGRSGASVSVRVNGKRKVFYGMAAQPASLFINKREGRLSDIVHAGDHIEFVPAVHGLAAKPCVKDIEGAAECLELSLNGKPADLETPLKNGDIIQMMLSDEQLAARKREAEEKAAEEAAAAAQREQEEAAAGAETEKKEDLTVEAEQGEALYVEEEPEGVLTVEEEPEGALAVEEEPEGALAVEEEPEGALAVEEEPEGALAVEEEPAGALAVEAESEEALAVEKEPAGALAVEAESGEALAIEEEPAGALAVEAESEEALAIEEEPAGALAVEAESEEALAAEAEPEKDILAETSISEAVNPESESMKQENPGTEAKPMKQEDPRTKTVSVTEPKPVSEPATEELQISQAEPIAEELQKYEAEPLTEEMWIPKAGLAEEKQESEPVKKEIDNAANKLYNADEKSLVQGTLNLELETGGKPSADAVPVRRHHSQSGGLSGKERTSKLPSIKEALASKGFSAKKEPAALRGSGTILFYLNDTPLRLPLKKDGDSYYLMDMIEYSGIDLKQPKGRVTLSVNGQPGTFMQKLHERDIIRIVEEI